MQAVHEFDALKLPVVAGERELGPDTKHRLQAIVEQLLTLDGAGACMRAAKGLEHLGRTQEAIAKLEEVKQLASDPVTIISAHIERGMLLSQAGQYETGVSRLGKYMEARQDLERGLQVADASLELQVDGYYRDVVIRRGRRELGIVLFCLKEYQRAAEVLEAILEQTEDCYLRYYLGFSQSMCGVLDKAMQNLQAAADLGDRDGLGGVVLAAYRQLASMWQQDPRKELGLLCDAVKAADKYRVFHALSSTVRRAGWLRFQFGETKEAEVCFKQALEAAFKIEDPQKQAQELFYSSACLKQFLEIRDGYFKGEFVDAADEEERRVLPLQLAHCQAEAMNAVGICSFLEGSLDKAWDSFEQGVELAAGNVELAETRRVMFELKWGQAQIHILRGEPLKASSMLQECIQIAPSQKHRVQCELLRGFLLLRMGERRQAVALFEEAATENATLLDTEPKMKAQLLYRHGQSLLALGRLKEGTEKLEAAKQIWEAVGDKEELSATCISLFTAYIQSQQLLAAFDIAKLFQDSDGGEWPLMSAIAANQVASNQVADNMAVEDALTKALEGAQDADLKFDALFTLANAYKRRGDAEKALVRYAEAMEVLGPPRDEAAIHIHINRAALYILQSRGNKDKSSEALEEYQRAVDVLLRCLKDVDRRHLATAYAGQATALLHMGQVMEASSKLDQAEAYTENDQLLIAKIKRIRASIILGGGGELQDALEEARGAALIYSEIQRSLQHLEFAWVSLLGGEMKHIYLYLQEQLVRHDRCLEALLWAERGRMRLYFHLISTQQLQQEEEAEYLDPELFDSDDQVAIRCIEFVMKQLPPGTGVIEYTYSDDEDTLYIYVVRMAPQFRVDTRVVSLAEFFEGHSGMGKTISSLVTKTRGWIRKPRTTSKTSDEGKAKLGLGILHELLLRPVEDEIRSCGTLVFAPYEKLTEVPFGALFDESEGKFLIEQKAVGSIPSLRALRYCLLRQQQVTRQDLSTAFVAGDPDPMGLGLPQLKGAREEARKVAEKLGVEPVLGPSMTKDAVVRGLTSKASIVAIMTHGVVDRFFPHGGLVMQASNKPILQPGFLSSSSSSNRGLDDVVSRAASRAAEVLSSKEIEKLRIESGLVVLSACNTGIGEASAEGMLGLGRAVLQAGAPGAVLTLWKVDDATARDFMIGMFEELADRGECIVNSLRTSVLNLLQRGLPIYNWAPFVAFGAPTLRL